MARHALQCALLALGACAAGPTPISTASLPLPDAVVRVPFVTVRAVRTDGRDRAFFSERRGPWSWGECLVTLGESSRPRVDAEVRAVVQRSDAEVLDALTGQGRLLVYVHGYNVGFDKGCRRAARMQANLGVGERLLLFSWPADGNVLNYLGDLADLRWSAGRLRILLERLATDPGAGQVDLLGHSLGAQGLVEALLGLEPATEAVFQTLTLAAPDIDRDLFLDDLPALRRRARLITVYASNHDRALAVSRRANGYARAGQAEQGLRYPGADLVDVSSVDTEAFSGHIYHLLNPAVVDDLKRVLGLASGGNYVRAGNDGVFALLPATD